MTVLESAPPTVSHAVRPGSPELALLLARLAEGASRQEQSRTAPFEQIGWVKQAGLGRLRVPVAEGGAGASLRELFATLIELADADSNVAHILRTHFWFVEQQLQSADPDARAGGLAVVTADELVGNGFGEPSRRLFDVGGASATQPAHNLDRHWRNIRVISTHNPTFLKASAIGAHEVSGTDFPGNAYF